MKEFIMKLTNESIIIKYHLQTNLLLNILTNEVIIKQYNYLLINTLTNELLLNTITNESIIKYTYKRIYY